MKRRVTSTAIVAVLMVGTLAFAQPIPEAQQVPIFFKLLTYDRTLSNGPEETLRIGILVRDGNGDSRDNGQAFAEALRNTEGKTVNGRPFEFVTIDWRNPQDLAARLRSADVSVLYVTHEQGDELDAVKELTRELDILTLAADGEYVRGGLSIGMSLDGNRPRILVNLEALHQEGHDLEARALRLCEVITEQ